MLSGSSVSAGGDIVLARVPGEEMGELAIEISDELGSQRILVGTLRVGGRFGTAFPCAPGTPCTIGPLAPGNYKLQFPEIGQTDSRFETSIAPAHRSTLLFARGGERKITLVSQSQSPVQSGLQLPAAVSP